MTIGGDRSRESGGGGISWGEALTELERSRRRPVSGPIESHRPGQPVFKAEFHTLIYPRLAEQPQVLVLRS